MAITTSIVWSINKPLRDASDGFVTQTEYSLIGQTKNGTVGIATFQMDQIIRFNIPLVVTLHDMWFFLPYSHYSVDIFEKKNFLSNVLSKYLIKQKKNLI